MASVSPYPTESNVALPNLTLQDVSSKVALHEILEPLLLGRSQPRMFNAVVPSVQREDGSFTKSFLFLVGLRNLPSAELRRLFPSQEGRMELSAMSPTQRTAYDALDERGKALYACFYSKAEWAANEKQCHKVSTAWSKMSVLCELL